jgi:predicted ester cyclase
MVIEANKTVVRRLVAEVLNGGHLEVIDELYAPGLVPAARRWIAPFRASFPDVRMEIVELIAEGDKVVGRFTCSATHLGEWLGQARLGAASSGSMRSPSSGSATARSSMPGR